MLEFDAPQKPGPVIEITGVFARNIKAFQTTRLGGVSRGPYDSFNLGLHVGDDVNAVGLNRALLKAKVGCEKLIFMQQVHGSRVEIVTDPVMPLICDGIVTQIPGLALCVMTADCLPLLMASKDGAVVAAVHCGWRSLQQNIVREAVRVMRTLTEAPLQAWMGPAAGPDSFEVGAELYELFTSEDDRLHVCFAAHDDGKYLLNLYALTRIKLNDAGVPDCETLMQDTITSPELFYSYRREKVTGRMAAVICKNCA